MGHTVWTLFLALRNATVNNSFPSPLGRVEISTYPALLKINSSEMSSLTVYICMIIQHTRQVLHIATLTKSNKSTYSYYPNYTSPDNSL